MAKQGQHKHDVNDPRISRGHNNHRDSTPITTGSYKKPETYRKQALNHEPTDRQGQDQKNEWLPNTRVRTSAKRAAEGEHRSGSDSGSSTETRGD